MDFKVKIYGRSVGCSFCDRAKDICNKLNLDMEFIDIAEANITSEELSTLCGTPVRTVPQIFVDDKYIGGCNDFIDFINNNKDA